MRFFVLCCEPDVYGFHCGNVRHNGNWYNLKALPPAGEWGGQSVLEGCEPDETDWKVFIDGNEVAQVRKQKEIGAEVFRLLMEG